MEQRGALGRGLGSLIPSASTLSEIDCQQIKPNPRQPRRRFDQDGLGELANSIKTMGVLQPVIVRQATDGYELVMGERRWRAAMKAGMAKIPAIVISTDDRGALERALVENVQRQDLNPIEQAAAFRQLIDDAGITHESLAERVGLSRPAVTNSMRLLELPTKVQEMVVDGKLSAGHARALLGLGEHPLVERLAQQAAGGAMSVRELEETVRRTLESTPAEVAAKVRQPTEQPPGLAEVTHRLSDALETRVSAVMGRGKGKLTIEFGSVEDLGRIVRRILQPPR